MDFVNIFSYFLLFCYSCAALASLFSFIMAMNEPFGSGIWLGWWQWQSVPQFYYHHKVGMCEGANTWWIKIFIYSGWIFSTIDYSWCYDFSLNINVKKNKKKISIDIGPLFRALSNCYCHRASTCPAQPVHIRSLGSISCLCVQLLTDTYVSANESSSLHHNLNNIESKAQDLAWGLNLFI